MGLGKLLTLCLCQGKKKMRNLRETQILGILPKVSSDSIWYFQNDEAFYIVTNCFLFTPLGGFHKILIFPALFICSEHYTRAQTILDGAYRTMNQTC